MEQLASKIIKNPPEVGLLDGGLDSHRPKDQYTERVFHSLDPPNVKKVGKQTRWQRNTFSALIIIKCVQLFIHEEVCLKWWQNLYLWDEAAT